MQKLSNEWPELTSADIAACTRLAEIAIANWAHNPTVKACDGVLYLYIRKADRGNWIPSEVHGRRVIVESRGRRKENV